ncbi:MAG: hypothetical protein U1E73_10895 [Planctomycetota bacterium]
MKRHTSSNRQACFADLIAFLLCAGCTSSSEFGVVLMPDMTATLLVSGDNPFVQVDNGDPSPIEVTSTPGVGAPDLVCVSGGSYARTLRGGGRLQFELVKGERANVRVQVLGSEGVELRTQHKVRNE